MLARPEHLDANAIASAIVKSKALMKAEEEVARCRAAQRDEQQALVEAVARNEKHDLDAEVARLDTNAKQAAQALHAARAVLHPLRAEHGARVAQAFDDFRAQAATRLLYGLEAMMEALDAIDASTVAIERAGGECLRLPVPHSLNALEAGARRLGGRIEDGAR